MNENAPTKAHVFEYSVPKWWKSLGRFKKYGLVVEDVTLDEEECVR